jgi:DNA-binding NarL/FixJ family response regulator
MNEITPLTAAAEPEKLKRRVLVIDDHPLMRRSMIEALEREPDFTVCGQAGDAAEGLAASASLHPDLVLTDLQLKASSGLDLIRQLQAQSPSLPVVATTMFDLRRNERLARAAGAAGFASKQDGPDQLIATLRTVLKTGRPGPHRPGGKQNE